MSSRALGAAVAGLPFGPETSSPGVLAFGAGISGIGVGSQITAVSGFGLFVLGDRRTGARALLDAAGGRVLKSLPEAFSPAINEAIGAYQDQFIDALDALDGHPGDIVDCN